MFEAPPMPTSWDAFHPLIVHFPVALLLVVPLLIILGIIFKNKANCFYISGFILLLLGTISTFIAVSTGIEAGEVVSILRTPEFNEAITEHMELATTTRTVFTILTVLYAVILFFPKIVKRNFKQASIPIAQIAFLIVYTYGLLLVSNTAHEGGRLVHEFGVKGNIVREN